MGPTGHTIVAQSNQITHKSISGTLLQILNKKSHFNRKITDKEVKTQKNNLQIIPNWNSSSRPHTVDTSAPHKPPDLPRPCPIFFNYQGSPSWRVILHVLCAWAGIGGNRCHPRRFDARFFVPEQVWEWERARGSGWPESTVHHTNHLTGGSDVKTNLGPNYARPFFFLMD